MYNPFQPYGYPQMNQLQNFRQPMYQQPQFIAKQVTNIEEARASMIDPLSTYLFVDTSTGKIYLKRMNNNGLSDFFVFTVEEKTAMSITDPLDEIKERLINIENKLGGLNVQSVSNYSGNAKSKPVDYSADTESKSSALQQSSGNDERKKQFRAEGNGK